MSLANAKRILAGMYDQGERDFRGFGSQLKGADLSGIDLEGCNLSGLDLAGTDFTQANLGSANLTGANLGFAILVGATLTRATMRNVDLTCAKVAKADVRFCILAGAKLGGANFWDSRVEPCIFTNATYNANTKFPEGFDHTSKGMVRAATTPQFPTLSTSVSESSPSSTTLDSRIPPTLKGGNPAQTSPNLTSPKKTNTTEAKPSHPHSDEKSAIFRGREIDETSEPAPKESLESQSRQPNSAPKKKRVLFRGRWVDM